MTEIFDNIDVIKKIIFIITTIFMYIINSRNNLKRTYSKLNMLIAIVVFIVDLFGHWRKLLAVFQCQQTCQY